MKIPGPDHPIAITPVASRWRAKFHDHVIADSAEALILHEANYPPVVYFPRGDVSTEYLSSTTHSTHCPFKGDAGYFTLMMDGEIAENAVWSYDTPFPAMQAIAQHVAFYPIKVEIYEVDDADVNPRRGETDVDQVVLHTDSGSGHAQREPWPANVNTPGDGGVR